MILIATVTKDGQIYERRILLKPQKQDIVRTRVEEIANPKDIVICEFEMMKLKLDILSVEKAEEIFRYQYGIEKKETLWCLANRFHKVMLLTEEEGLALTDSQWKGDYGEWTTFQILWDYGLFEDYQVEIEGTKGSIMADFKAKRKRLVEVKTAEPCWVYDDGWLKNTKDELVRYKGAVEAGNAEEVILFLRVPFGQEELAFLESKLNEWFKDLSWLKICNGKGEFIKYLARS